MDISHLVPPRPTAVPTVFTDALSYSETIGKLIKAVQDLQEDVNNAITELQAEIRTAIENMEADIDAELDTKLDIDDYIVDAVLSTESENPVQNKVVTEAINGKLDASDYVVDGALSGTSENPVQNKVITEALAEVEGATEVLTYNVAVPTVAVPTSDKCFVSCTNATTVVLKNKVNANKPTEVHAIITLGASGGSISTQGITGYTTIESGDDHASTDLVAGDTWEVSSLCWNNKILNVYKKWSTT